MSSAEFKVASACPTGGEHDIPDAEQLLAKLGEAPFAHDGVMLFQFVREIAESKNPDALIQSYIQLILKTRKTESDPDEDPRLVTAASNAISILNYGGLCGAFASPLGAIRDWTSIRVPYANLSLACLTSCIFDHADLSNATLAFANLRGASFQHALMKNINLGETKVLSSPSNESARSYALSPNAELVAIGEWSRGITMWNLKSFESFPVPSSQRALTVGFSPDGQELAAGNGQNVVTIWHIAGREPRLKTTLKAHTAGVECLAFTPDGCYLASGGRDKTVRVWNRSQNFTLQHTLEGHTTTVKSLAFSADGALLASGSQDNTVRVWDVATGQWLATLDCDQQTPLRLAFSSDGSKLAAHVKAFQAHPKLFVWSVPSGDLLTAAKTIMQIPGIEFECPTYDGFEQRNAEMDLAHETCEGLGINVWDLYIPRRASFLNPLLVHPQCKERANLVVVSTDGRYGVCEVIGRDCLLTVMDLACLGWVEKLRRHASELSPRGSCYVCLPQLVVALALSRDSRLLAVADARHVAVLDTDTGRCEARFFLRDSVQVTRLGFSADNTSVIVSSRGVVGSYTLDEQSDGLQCYAISRDERGAFTGLMNHEEWLAAREARRQARAQQRAQNNRAGSQSASDAEESEEDYSDEEFDSEEEEENDPTTASLELPNAVPSPIGATIALIYGQHVILANKETRRVETVYTSSRMSHQFDSCAFSPDGKRLAGIVVVSGARNTQHTLHLYAWDLENHRLCFQGKTGIALQNPDYLQALYLTPGRAHVKQYVGFSPRGRFIVTWGFDARIHVWDIDHHKFKLAIRVSEDCEVYSVVWSSDERYLFAACSDRTIRIWSIRTGRLKYLLRTPDQVMQMALTRNDMTLITSGPAATPLLKWRVVLPQTNLDGALNGISLVGVVGGNTRLELAGCRFDSADISSGTVTWAQQMSGAQSEFKGEEGNIGGGGGGGEVVWEGEGASDNEDDVYHEDDTQLGASSQDRGVASNQRGRALLGFGGRSRVSQGSQGSQGSRGRRGR